MSTWLLEAIEEATDRGIATIAGQPDPSTLSIEDRGWSLTRSEDLLARQSVTQDGWTASDRYGLGAFPWHTDGAIARVPPRFIVLQNLVSSPVPTEAAKVPSYVRDQMHRVVLRARDRRGRTRLLSAIDRSHGDELVRWDPRSCTIAAGPPQLEAAVDAIEAEYGADWASPTTVVIDNWKMLHRRPPVPEGQERALRRWYIKGPH